MGTMMAMMIVYLVGFMGCGKTSIGKALAALGGLDFVDMDVKICERMGLSVKEIFARYSESTFRHEESLVLQWTTQLPGAVVATGGGTFCSPANREIIKQAGGVSVFIDVAWNVIRARLPGNNTERPKFKSPEAALQLFKQRQPQYRLARFAISPSQSDTPAKLAHRILGILKPEIATEDLCAS